MAGLKFDMGLYGICFLLTLVLFFVRHDPSILVYSVFIFIVFVITLILSDSGYDKLLFAVFTVSLIVLGFGLSYDSVFLVSQGSFWFSLVVIGAIIFLCVWIYVLYNLVRIGALLNSREDKK